MSTTAKDHLDWCIEQSLQAYETDGSVRAIAVFATNLGGHEETAQIAERSSTYIILATSMCSGPEAFKKAASNLLA